MQGGIGRKRKREGGRGETKREVDREGSRERGKENTQGQLN